MVTLDVLASRNLSTYFLLLLYTTGSHFIVWLEDLVKVENWASPCLTRKERRFLNPTAGLRVLSLVFHWIPGT